MWIGTAIGNNRWPEALRILGFPKAFCTRVISLTVEAQAAAMPRVTVEFYVDMRQAQDATEALTTDCVVVPRRDYDAMEQACLKGVKELPLDELYALVAYMLDKIVADNPTLKGESNGNVSEA